VKTCKTKTIDGGNDDNVDGGNRRGTTKQNETERNAIT
jgi:hypothetical protein